MTETKDAAKGTPGDAPTSAARHARDAFDAARDSIGGPDPGPLRAKASDAAAALYRTSRDLLANNPEFDKAKDELRESIRKNPLAAIGIAFTAGLLVALITRS